MRRFATLLVVAFAAACLSCHGCEDDAAADGWPVGDDVAPAEWQPLGGLPGSMYRYVGSVDQRHYFIVGYRTLGSYWTSGGELIVARYTPGEGWTEDERVGELLSYEARRANINGRPPGIVEAGGSHFLVSLADHTLYATGDGGASWTPAAPLPAGAPLGQLASDGDVLLLWQPTRDDEPAVWRSADGGQSWQIVADEDAWEEAGELLWAGGVDGLFVAVTSNKALLSSDGGRSWTAVDDACRHGLETVSRRPWDGAVFTVAGGRLRQLHDDGACPLAPGDGLPDDPRLIDLVGAGGDFYAASETRLWRLAAGASRWEEVVAPEGYAVGLRRQGHNGLIDFGDAGLAVTYLRGLWTCSQANWRAHYHDYAFPYWIEVHEGATLAPGPVDFFFHRPVAGDDWQPLVQFRQPDESFSNGYLVSEGGHLFGIGWGPSVYLVDPDDASHSMVWEDPDSNPTDSRRDPPADVVLADGRVFIGSEGGQGTVLTPGSDAAAQYGGGHLGGGVWWAPSVDGEFRPFGQGLPQTTEGHPASIQSMVAFDGALWVVTAAHGVWRAPLDDGQWAPVHDGLPADMRHDLHLPVQALAAGDGALFAHSGRALYLYDDGRWRRLTSDAFATTFADYTGTYVVDVGIYRGQLYAITHLGVYGIDRQEGGETLFWRPEAGWIRTGRVLASGLYVSASFDGVWRYAGSE